PGFDARRRYSPPRRNPTMLVPRKVSRCRIPLRSVLSWRILPAWRSENPAPQLKVADAGRRPDATKVLGRTKARMLMAAVGDIRRRREFIDAHGSVINCSTNHEFYCHASAKV